MCLKMPACTITPKDSPILFKNLTRVEDLLKKFHFLPMAELLHLLLDMEFDYLLSILIVGKCHMRTLFASVNDKIENILESACLLLNITINLQLS